MNILKITMLSAFTALSMGWASASFAQECADGCVPPPPPPEGPENPPPPPPEEPQGGNPGNAKPVGNSRYDGITGNSGNNNPGPRASTMDGQRSDSPYAQPSGGNGPSSANK